jgi:hypothetical protein
MSTQPFTKSIVKQAVVRDIYRQETTIDPYVGAWPPDDTGSDGLSACKIAKLRGWITGYAHAFSVDDVLVALQHGPVITGVPWHQEMFTPDKDGFVRVSGPVVGGHEFCLTGFNAEQGYLTFANSWGSAWGQAGYAKLTLADYASLLADHGDATVPHNGPM